MPIEKKIDSIGLSPSDSEGIKNMIKSGIGMLIRATIDAIKQLPKLTKW